MRKGNCYEFIVSYLGLVVEGASGAGCGCGGACTAVVSGRAGAGHTCVVHIRSGRIRPTSAVVARVALAYTKEIGYVRFLF